MVAMIALLSAPLVARPKALRIHVYGELVPVNLGCSIRLTYRLPIEEMEDFESVATEILVEYRLKDGALQTQRYSENWHHHKGNGDSHEVEHRLINFTDCNQITLTGRIQVLKAECR